MKIKNQFKGWKDELQSLINDNNHLRANGRIASNETQAKRADFLFMFFNLLRDNGFAVAPHNLKQKHIQFFCNHLAGKGSDRKVRSAATIQTYLSMISLFCRWIGKNGMVGDISKYFENPNFAKREYAATSDKSWEGSGIDVQKMIDEISINYPYVGIQLLVVHAFGLRRKEAIRLRPSMSVIDNKLHIVDGAKNGKTRIFKIETDYQKDVITLAQQFVGRTSRELSDPQLDLKQSLKKYSNVLQKYGLTKKALGATGHGGRCSYAHNFMIRRGLIPLVKGGEVGAQPKSEEMDIRLNLSANLGHNRVGITTAYSGPFTKAGKRKIDKPK